MGQIKEREGKMKLERWLPGAVGLLVIGNVALPARAAPISGTAAAVGANASRSAFTDQVAARHCSHRHESRHCSWYGQRQAYRYRSGNSDYYEHDSNSLAFGSQRWWDQMLRENRLNSGGGKN
jgi:hypothetical protein